MAILNVKPTPARSLSSNLREFLREPDTLRFRLPLAILLIAYVVMHILAAYNLPTPWPDEAHFMWQANGFAEHFTLFSPELNGERSILWMPPGYLVVLGILFKLFGLSLNVARTFSLLTSLTGIALLIIFVRRYIGSLAALILSIPFVLGIPMVAAGNIARMESLLLSVLFAAYLLLSKKKWGVALCLLALSPLIHPSGIPFLIAGLISAPFLAEFPLRLRKPSTATMIAIAAVILAWTAYALYVRAHWSSFVPDMNFQYQRKAARDLVKLLLTQSSVSLALLVALAAIYGVRRRMKVGLLLALAFPSWWVAVAGAEMWYMVFFAIAFFCFTAIFYMVIGDICRRFAVRWKQILYGGLLGLLSLVAIGWNVRVGPEGQPLVFPELRGWRGMGYSSSPYITQGEIQRIESHLAGLASGSTLTLISFYPQGDAFFFAKLRSSRVLFNCPLFCERKSDWCLLHLASRIPGPLRDISMKSVNELGLGSEDLLKYTLYQRDSTDRWILVPGKPDSLLPAQTNESGKDR